jgi:hypothetical protein
MSYVRWNEPTILTTAGLFGSRTSDLTSGFTVVTALERAFGPYSTCIFYHADTTNPLAKVIYRKGTSSRSRAKLHDHIAIGLLYADEKIAGTSGSLSMREEQEPMEPDEVVGQIRDFMISDPLDSKHIDQFIVA